MRDTVTPRTQLARVNAALQQINGAADAAEIEKHAVLIQGAMLNLITAYRACGFIIGGSDADGYHARPRTKTTGPARELTELAAKCRKAIAGKISLQDWTTVWAAQPERIKALWKPTLVETAEGRTIDRGKLALGFEVEGFAMIAPKPKVVQPAIEAAFGKITATPNEKKRTRNVDEARAINVIRAAYRAVTGNQGGRVISEGKLVGRLIRLGHEIDGIFGTKLFAENDSRRLR